MKTTEQKNLDDKANQANRNKGTSGTNKANSHVNGNKGAQLNPNNPKNK